MPHYIRIDTSQNNKVTLLVTHQFLNVIFIASLFTGFIGQDQPAWLCFNLLSITGHFLQAADIERFLQTPFT